MTALAVPAAGGVVRTRWRNAALLIGGYAAGQGAIFAVQTSLLVQEQLHLLTGFGLAFSFAILGTLIVDLGALTVLAREAAQAEGEPDGLWDGYWAMTACRLVVGAGIAGAAGLYALLTDDAFSRAYATWALPVALLWSFNAAGILDGLRLSGINGIAGTLPYLSSAVMLAGVGTAEPATSGMLLGAALSVGCVLTLGGQFAALKLAGRPPRLVRPTRARILAMGRDGLAALLGTLPGQLYLRYQLFLASVVIGPAGTALFLYAKQVATAAAQCVGFVRRAEFPDVVARLAEVRGDMASPALRVQSGGTRLGVLGAAVLAAGGTVAGLTLSGSLAEAATATAMFAPALLVGAIATALVQGLQATRRYAIAAGVMAASVAAGALLNAGALLWPTVAIFALADLAVYVVATMLARTALRPGGWAG